MSDKVWHYSVGDERHGPIAAEELRRLVAAGDIGPDDLVWKQGMPEWVAAGTIKGLFAKSAAPPKPAPPPLPPKGMSAAAAAPLTLDDAGKDDKPAKTKAASPLQPVLATWQKMPMPAKIGVAGGGLLFVLVMCCGGFAIVGSRFMGGGGGDSTLDAAKLARDYDADRKAADLKYKGKTLTVTGVISIPYEGLGSAHVHLEEPQDLKGGVLVVAEFGAKYERDLARLRRGDTIRFRGLCEGDVSKPEHLPHVNFVNCELLSGDGGKSGTQAEGKGGRGRPGGNAAKGRMADDLLKQVRVGMSKQEVANVLGQPDVRNPLGQGEACLYYVNAREAIFISFDRTGRVFTVHKQDREN